MEFPLRELHFSLLMENDTVENESNILEAVNASSILKIFNHQAGIILWIKDANGVYQYANAEYLRHFFLNDQKDLTGKTDFDFVPKYIAEAFLEDDALVLKGKEILNRLELVSFKDNILDWYLTDKMPLRNKAGKILGTVGITRKVDSIKGPQVPEDSILKIMKHIKNNYTESLSVVEMAKISCLSISAFERKFKKYFKITPTEYILKFRINQVCRSLVYTSKSISEIALECGFCDHSYMTRQFKKIMSCSPSKFRSKYLNS